MDKSQSTNSALRFWAGLALLLFAIFCAHYIARMTGTGAANLQDTLFAVGVGYWVGWASHGWPTRN